MNFDFDKVLNNKEEEIKTLEKELKKLTPETYFEVEHFPRNIQKDSEDLEEIDEDKKYSERIVVLREKFEQVVKKYNLDRKYFGLKEKE